MSIAADGEASGLFRPSGKHQIIPQPVGARAGAPAPWDGRPIDPSLLSVEAIRATFADIGPPVRSPREATQEFGASAVLAPLYAESGDTWVLLTRRTMTLRSHRGEVSFPGGRRESGDVGLEATARREAREEVNLHDNFDIVGELDHLSTITSGSFIVPYVGVLPVPPGELTPNPGEVDAILRVKLATLLEVDRYRSEIWPMPDGSEHPIVFFDLEEDTIWGATAAMLRQLLGFLTGTVARGGMGHI